MHTLEQLRAGQLAGATRLDLSCGLTELPRDVFDVADTLEVLNLSGNALTDLPHDLPRLKKLKVLFCSDNAFTRVPEVVGACENLSMVGFKANRLTEVPAAALPPRLRWLILTDNQISDLPSSLGERPALEKVALAGNRLQSLPESMAQCANLALLRISANRFERIPGWLLQLPKLAWLAMGGNPWGEAREAQVLSQAAVPAVPWADLQLGPVLGQGASGVIHAAQWPAGPAGLQDLAVKVFKGEVTSDGWPHSEWAASLAAGAHPHLIAAQGRIIDHPNGADGLLMPRISPDYKTLAQPPSLESCSRDVYPEGAAITPRALQAMAHGVASACQHLHAHGISHGDLYGHNLMWNGLGGVWLGDFGAATLLPHGLPAQQRQAFERLEVLAFGYLLEEWLARCDEAPAALHAMQAACVQATAAHRPLFAELFG